MTNQSYILLYQIIIDLLIQTNEANYSAKRGRLVRQLRDYIMATQKRERGGGPAAGRPAKNIFCVLKGNSTPY